MEGVFVEEVPTGFVLLLVEANHKLDMCDSLALGPAKGLNVR
jgi:hypothetical protein